VQVLNVSINKLVKKFIKEEEQIYYDNNLDTFAAETVNISVGHRYLDTYLRGGSGRYLPEWRELR
jgi:hypothetical protein